MGCVSSNEDTIIANTGKKAVGGEKDFLEDRMLDIGDGNELKQRIQLSFEAQKLANLDKGSKSDPFLVLFLLKNNMQQRVG